MKTLRIVAGFCAVALMGAAPVPKGACAGTPQVIVSFDGEAVRIELKDEKSGETEKLAVDETAVPGWKSYFRVGDKVTLSCSYPPERGKALVVKIQKVAQ
jgi:hypothetical protein